MSEQVIELMRSLYGYRPLLEAKGLVATGKDLIELVLEKNLEDHLMDMGRYVGEEIHIAYYVQQSGNILQLTNWSIANNLLAKVESAVAEKK